MSFSTFCNICFMKENIIKLYVKENEPILNILTSFTSCYDIVNGIIYLCINCCNKLEEYDKFRELFLTNFVRFRYLYNEYRTQLEISNAPDIETQLKAFVDVNVERVSGTPLIENYEAAQALINAATCNIDITCKKCEFSEMDLENMNRKNDFINNTGEIQICHVKSEIDSVEEDQENINGSSIHIKSETSLVEEVSHGITNTDTVATSMPCSSSEYNENINNIRSTQKTFIKEEIILDEDGPDEENKATESDTQKRYNCDKCHESFTRSSHLTEHQRLHSGKKLYKCDVCCVEFTKRGNLNRHKRTHIGEMSYDFHKTFVQSSSLTGHKHSHSGEKPYTCDECGLRFTRRSNLNKHKRIHNGETPYHCDECNRKFTHRSYLLEHKLSHSSEKPYKCDQCRLGFTKRDDLNRHTRTHTGEKPYTCDECQKKFTYSTSLKVHKRIHSGEKPYQCDECDSRFKSRRDLNRHKSSTLASARKLSHIVHINTTQTQL